MSYDRDDGWVLDMTTRIGVHAMFTAVSDSTRLRAIWYDFFARKTVGKLSTAVKKLNLSALCIVNRIIINFVL